jgi:hypothetical protein
MRSGLRSILRQYPGCYRRNRLAVIDTCRYFAEGALPAQPDVTIRYPRTVRTDYGKTLRGINITL